MFDRTPIVRVHVSVSSQPLRCAIVEALSTATTDTVASVSGPECDVRVVHAGEAEALRLRDGAGPLTLVVIDDPRHALDVGDEVAAAGYLDARELHLIAPMAVGVTHGVICMSPCIVAHLRANRRADVPECIEALTEREREVLDCFVDGLSYAEAAGSLGISINTVRQHVRHIYDKLDVCSKSAAVAAMLSGAERR